ncbi:LOW QUALITY PROTEIN: hypothetical protein T265_15174 [Opisthorchis viverrini]|uniref:Uncharacterized protein n=1 Tax=Opisthorchis viverrini TaxID=6198 RepID=A0A075A0X2_OPIVI|nr:LOW QUALITY PROTEIN: hypothetical protein T265_15174 [Opisthorchis viverrini]KER21059.1 LOW QUALITY PROTEIN: hypothetical protein T265_15174 [Opisthorchis viverrini]
MDEYRVRAAGTIDFNDNRSVETEPWLNWDPAGSLVCDVLRQLNVLHQAASCFTRYDVRDIAIHVDLRNESLVCDVLRQLNVLHQAASCFSRYDIRDIAIHVYLCNVRLPKIRGQPTTGFTLFGAHLPEGGSERRNSGGPSCSCQFVPPVAPKRYISGSLKTLIATTVCLLLCCLRCCARFGQFGRNIGDLFRSSTTMVDAPELLSHLDCDSAQCSTGLCTTGQTTDKQLAPFLKFSGNGSFRYRPLSFDHSQYNVLPNKATTICNVLLIRLLKIHRQPTTGFALPLGAHNAQSPSFRPPHALLETILHKIREYTPICKLTWFFRETHPELR